VAIPRRPRWPEPKAETTPLLAALRARDPVVVRGLWRRYSPLVVRVLHCAFRGDERAVDAAAQEVFLQVFRWGPTLPRDAQLKMFVMRAVTRVVGRVSRPTPAAWEPGKSAKTIRGRADFELRNA